MSALLVPLAWFRVHFALESPAAVQAQQHVLAATVDSTLMAQTPTRPLTIHFDYQFGSDVDASTALYLEHQVFLAAQAVLRQYVKVRPTVYHALHGSHCTCRMFKMLRPVTNWQSQAWHVRDSHMPMQAERFCSPAAFNVGVC